MGRCTESRRGRRGDSAKVLVDVEALTCLKETGFTWEALRLRLVAVRKAEMEEREKRGYPGPSEKTFGRILRSGQVTEDFGASLLGMVRDVIRARHKEWGHLRNLPVEEMLPFTLADWGPIWEQIKEERRRRIAGS